MIAAIREFLEFLWLYFKGFRPVEFVRGDDRVSLHPFGWRANGTGRMKRAKDAVAYLDAADAEQWRQIYCGMTPFLVSDRGNVKHIDGRPAKLFLSNGRYQVLYKPEDARGRGRNGRDHKKRVYRSMLVAMAFLDFKKGDDTREIHHVNGYRTDDRLINLLVLTHEDHTRIHNMGPCGLSGTRDDALALLAEAKATDDAGNASAPETGKAMPASADETMGSATHPDTDGKTAHPSDSSARTTAPSKKRRRGRRGGRNRRAATEASMMETNMAKASASGTPAATCAPAEKNLTHVPTEGGAPNTDAPEAPNALGAPDASSTPPASDGHGISSAVAEGDASDSSAAPSANSPAAEPSLAVARQNADIAAPKKKAEPPSRNQPSKSVQSRPDGIDLKSARAQFEKELDRFLEACAPDEGGAFAPDKRLTKQCKSVYRALRPFQACPDPIAQFDAVLTGIRAIAGIESEWGKTGPSTLQSLLGELHRLLKDATKRLAAGDDLERLCTEELLRDELARPLYAKSSSARKLRQCLSVACSRKEQTEDDASTVAER